MAYIEVKNVSKIFHTADGDDFTALTNVSLDIEEGEFICLLGPSGCGKSTLLNAIAGFDLPSTGSIKIEGKEVTAPSIKNVTIFQNYGLLPWRTIQSNVELGLETLKIPEQERHEIALTYLAKVGLEKFANNFPSELSGGMQQRVAIARALAVDPKIIFMDEPFAALDAITRMKMQDEVSELCSQYNKTFIFVTHDIEEAIVLANRIVIMTPNPGRIKSIVEVKLGKHRDRTSRDFLNLREKVFDEFTLKPHFDLEYNL